MKSFEVVVLVLLTLLLAGSLALGVEHKASVEQGKALFNDPKLGSTGKSCNDCHPAGKGIEKAAGTKNLEAIVNGCITQALQGKALDVRSVEIQSLVQYINSLGGMKKQETKKAPVGC